MRCSYCGADLMEAEHAAPMDCIAHLAERVRELEQRAEREDERAQERLEWSGE